MSCCSSFALSLRTMSSNPFMRLGDNTRLDSGVFYFNVTPVLHDCELDRSGRHSRMLSFSSISLRDLQKRPHQQRCA